MGRTNKRRNNVAIQPPGSSSSKSSKSKQDPPSPLFASYKFSFFLIFILFILLIQTIFSYLSLESPVSNTIWVQSHTPRLPKVSLKWNIPCSSFYTPYMEGCHLYGNQCARIVHDDFISNEQVMQLRTIAERGMEGRDNTGGPTIMDMNSGYVKDGNGLINLYQDVNAPPRFTKSDFILYKSVVEKIRQTIMQEFELTTLYFTAPTFLTRLVGNISWTPQDLHDEYWHPHVDKENTLHYDYSGLVYLSDYDIEFTGGLFSFIDDGQFNTIEPAQGRFLYFTAGQENVHQVQQVESGMRYVMALWFSCNPDREFHQFLDGRPHQHFAVESNNI